MSFKMTVTDGGKTYANWTEEELRAANVDAALIDAAVAAHEKIAGTAVIRGKISETAGDHLSLLGTTSDVAAIAILACASFVASLDETTDFAAFCAKATAYMQSVSGEQDPIAIAQQFLATVAAGDIRIPALEKGIVAVIEEVSARSNAVAEALNPASIAEA